MPENEKTKQQGWARRQVARGSNLVSRYNRLAAGIGSLGENVRYYSIGDSVQHYNATLDDEVKRWLVRLNVPESVLSLGEGFAQNARFLRDARLSAALEVIPKNCFNGCKDLAAINWEELTNLKQILENGFAGTNVRDVPELPNLEVIGKGAFAYSNLRHIALGENVRYIGDGAFLGNKALVDQNKAMFGGIKGEFTLPKSVEYIGAGAFAGCYKVKKLVIDDNVKEISGNPFYDKSLVKENGKLPLRVRWHNWHAKMDIPGLDKPIRARRFEKMETNFDGLRHIQVKDKKGNIKHYIQKEDGSYDVYAAKEYQEWLTASNEKYKAFHITKEQFAAYYATQDIILDPQNIPQHVIDAAFNGDNLDKEISVQLTARDRVKISPKAIKEAIIAMENAKPKETPKQETPEPEPASENQGPTPPQDEKDKAPVQLPVETNWDLNNLTLAQQQFLNDHGASNLAEFMKEHNIDPNDQTYVNNFFNSYAKNLGVPRMEDRQAETIRAIMEENSYTEENGVQYQIKKLPTELREKLQQLIAEQGIDATNYEAAKALAYNPDNRELVSAIADSVAPRQQGDEGFSKE